MKLKEQEEFAFEAVDMGNLYHGVLEIFAEKLKEIGKNWFDFTEEEGERLVDEAVDAYAVTYHHTVLFDSARNAYIVQRIKRILKRTVSAMQYQLKKAALCRRSSRFRFRCWRSWMRSISRSLSRKNAAARQDRPCGYERRPGACLCQGRGL